MDATQTHKENQMTIKIETIRSTFLSEDILGGTKLFLHFDGVWFRVETRFQSLSKSKSINTALTKFEAIVAGASPF